MRSRVRFESESGVVDAKYVRYGASVLLDAYAAAARMSEEPLLRGARRTFGAPEFGSCLVLETREQLVDVDVC